MTEKRSDRIVIKLKNLLLANEYYEAHQLNRTIFFRYVNGGRFHELQELLYEGADYFLTCEQYTSGADIASLYLEAINQDTNIKQRFNEDEKYCVQLAQRIGDLLHRIPSKSNERVSFMVAALKLKADVFP